MTTASAVKQCLASLKGIESELSGLAIRTEDEESQRKLHQAMITVHEIVLDMERRAGEMEQEEPTYKGF
ncbi:DUF1657 domain-containing protein [Peribacillus sp. B-H-3]|uniref:DUF1657 domain-containing protein n=1 Tax=Bacillaceae TaxID=186817 RepID=UPI0008F56DA6|nr:DUF1657 domain-containing protein [Bacillus sp. MUM 13]OIK14876.1 hypothetical protein BIV59_01465 [Bacillus sp. MUM 13]